MSGNQYARLPALLALAALFALGGCAPEDTSGLEATNTGIAGATNSATGSEATSASESEAEAATTTAAEGELLKKYGKQPVVALTTSMGTIKLQLDGEKAPVSAENFLQYVESGHFNNTIFHRVIPNFMIQGGGFTADMKEKSTRDPIENEAGNGLKNERGTLAMARTSIPNSATAQFFVNLKDNAFLNRENAQDGVGYAVFGKVIDGMNVVDKIAAVETTTKGGHGDVPVKAVVIQSAKVVKQ